MSGCPFSTWTMDVIVSEVINTTGKLQTLESRFSAGCCHRPSTVELAMRQLLLGCCTILYSTYMTGRVNSAVHSNT